MEYVALRDAEELKRVNVIEHHRLVDWNGVYLASFPDTYTLHKIFIHTHFRITNITIKHLEFHTHINIFCAITV